MPNSATVQDPPARTVFWIFLALAMLALLPVLCAHHLLLLDAPAHESRLAILRDLLTGGHRSPFYALDTLFIPNIAFDLIGVGLTSLASPEAAGRIFFAMTLVLTLSGVLVLNRAAIGRWSLLPLAATLLLYNLVSSLGFFSYAFGLALVPWALAARLKLDSAPPFVGTLAGAGIGLLLLFCHVFDFAIYAAMSAGFALTALLERRIVFRAALPRALEPVPAVLLFLRMSTGSGSVAGYDSNLLASKLFGLAKSATSGSMTGDAAFVAGASAFILLLVLCSRPRLVRAFIPGLMALAALYVVLPANLASGSYVDIRMPIAIMLLVLAGLDARIARTNLAVVLVAVFGLALTVKQGALAVLWRSFDAPVDAIARSFAALPQGAVVLQMECQPASGGIRGLYRQRQPSMSHLATMAAFADSRFAGGNYAIPGQQPIRVATAYQPYYRLQASFGPPTCDVEGYRGQLARTRALAMTQAAAGRAVPPIYYFLVRPPVPESLAGEAELIAHGADYELYAVNRPPGGDSRRPVP